MYRENFPASCNFVFVMVSVWLYGQIARNGTESMIPDTEGRSNMYSMWYISLYLNILIHYRGHNIVKIGVLPPQASPLFLTGKQLKLAYFLNMYYVKYRREQNFTHLISKVLQ